uniref:Uncharacterized protein n=1 Tax=Kwoniella pini CBS 10737 TaxID=1296096 RepID=A0A1B9I6N0_9TREE|nr:uncharacterized protein I206_03260 [Kwoniella pini CBS 10737]OCF51194.1 hypothetical protein I206_03260 [Kwoniella pini CBS 10737]
MKPPAPSSNNKRPTFHNLAWAFSDSTIMLVTLSMDRSVGSMIIAASQMYRYMS